MSPDLNCCWAGALCVRVCLCEMLFAALMKGDTMQEWQQVISLCQRWFICVFVCLWSETGTGKKTSQWQDVNHKQGGGMSYESQLCPSIFLIFLITPFHLLPIPVIPPACWGWWWARGCKWGVGGWSWPFFISLYFSVCLSVCPVHLLLSSLLMTIWILVEDGIVLANHGWRLNLKCPLREPLWWEEGMQSGGQVWEKNNSASIH